MPIKSTVYVLPDTEARREDFEWISREIRAVGGDAVLTSAQLLEGQMVVGIAAAHERDEDRLVRSHALLDDPLPSFGT